MAGCHIWCTAGAEDDIHRREADLSEREEVLAAQLKKLQADRLNHREAANKVCDAAKERDVDADDRDQIAMERDQAADLKAFASPDSGSGYGADLPARRNAALDRRDAKDDRTSSADDRAALTEVDDDPEVPAKENGLEEK